MLAKRAASVLVLLPILFFGAFLGAQTQVPFAGAQTSAAPYPYKSPVMQRLWKQKHVHPASASQPPAPITSLFLTLPLMYAAGSEPADVAIGDFNGDGNKDAIVAADPPLLLLGNGGGALGAPVSIGSISSTPTSVAVGDFNRDGNLDAVFAIAGGAVVYLGNGNGTFAAGTTFSSGGTNNNETARVLAADVNNDGILDLILNTDSGITVLLGVGNGSFLTPITSAGVVWAMAVGDFNGDGKLDLAVTNGFDSLTIMLGNGAGDFTASAGYSVPYANLNALAVADYNRDGFQDVALPNGQLYLGNGNGTLQAPISFSEIGSAVIGTADVNGDRIPDLIMPYSGGFCGASNFGYVAQFIGNGNGTFQPAIGFPTGGCLFEVPFLAVGDLNNDGLPDFIVWDNTAAELSVVVSTGKSTYDAAELNFSGGSGTIAVADFNNDGNADVGLADGSVYLGGGNGTLNFLGGSGSFGAVAVETGDFNHDGNQDIAAALECASTACSSGGLLIALGKGDGTFQTPVILPSGGYFSEAVVVADFNHDGNLDVAVVNNCNDSACSSVGSVSIFLGNGSGGFSLSDTISAASSYPADIVAGDFNNDGNVDLAVGLLPFGVFFPSTFNVFLGKGNGFFQSPIVVTTPDENGVTAEAVGDFNDDGILDLALADGGICSDCNASGRIMYGNGDGTFTVGPEIETGGGPPISAVAADFLGVGSPTPVLANRCLDSLDCSNGSIMNVSAPDVMLLFLGVGDFNNDGKPDLAGSLQFGSGASVLLNIGATLAASTTTLSPAAMQTHLEFQPVSFTALVQHTGPATPTGTVQFLDGGVLVGTGTVNSSGEASLTTTGLGIGAHFVVAYYMGDTNFAPSNSLGAHITITRTNTETEVSSSVNPSELDEPVTFTARIEALFGSGETGTVTFFDGPKKIGSGKVSAGKATFTTRALAVGTHYISAMYSGDANFEGSRSMLLSQVVK